MADDDPQPPRRRVTDRNRSSLERQLDLVNERVDDYSDRLDDVTRRLSELRTDISRMSERMDTLFDRNFKEHQVVQAKADLIAERVKPSKLDWAVKFATIVSFLLVPILAAYVAAGAT